MTLLFDMFSNKCILSALVDVEGGLEGVDAGLRGQPETQHKLCCLHNRGKRDKPGAVISDAINAFKTPIKCVIFYFLAKEIAHIIVFIKIVKLKTKEEKVVMVNKDDLVMKVKNNF